MQPFTEVARFVDPPWNAPLDVKTALAAIPPDASIAGMFFTALLGGAKRRQVELLEPRERYLPFKFYPVAEFAPLLVAAAERFYPGRSLRRGLEAIGRLAPAAFSGSVLGKATLGAAQDVHGAVAAIARTYSINIPQSRCNILSSTDHSIVLSMTGVAHFLDSHHVGVFEGTLEHAGAPGRVRIASHSRFAADLLLEWD